MGAKGAEAFDRHYRQLYGQRWSQLRQALVEPTSKVPIEGLNGSYLVDPASLQAAQLLPLAGGEQVVDLCAAPGGKALMLAMRLPDGALHANDSSRQRCHRLRQNVLLLPPEAARISISCADATRWGMRHPSSADCVLLDAPCSSEQHLLASPTQLREWSPARSRQLAQRQLALACAACDTLRPGGTLFYLTCALSPLENEQLVARLLRKRACLRSETLPTVAGAQSQGKGLLFLPDRGQGGPLFCCLLRKES